MKAKLIKILTVASLSVASLAAVVGVAISHGLKAASSIKAGDTRYVEITAEDIKAAIGDGHTGEATIAGLRWSFTGATVEDGKVNFSEGSFYNIDHAGQAVNPETGLGGGGFKSWTIYDYRNYVGMHFEARDLAGVARFQSNPGANADVEPEYSINFESYNVENKLTQAFFAFGAGDGVTFSKIRLYYECVEFEPELVISAPTAINPGEQIQLNTELKYTTESIETIEYYSGDHSVATIDENGLITAEGAGNVNITAVATLTDSNIVQSNELLIQVSNKKDIFKRYSIFQGSENQILDHRGELVYFTDNGATAVGAPRNGIAITHTPGAQWWANQLFYTSPYSDRYDSFTVSFTVTSTVSGLIQINGSPYEIFADTPLNVRLAQVVASSEYNTILSIALGEFNSKTQLPAGTTTFTNFRLYDLNNTYHTVEYDVDGSAFEFDYVKNNKTPFKVPEAPEKSGYVFKGWYDETDVKLTESYLVTDDTLFNAVYVEEGALDYYDVTVKTADGTTIQFMHNVPEETVLTLSDFNAPLYRKVLGVYTDDGLSSEYDFAPLASDLELFVKLGVAATGTYKEGDPWKIPNEHFSNAEDGALHLQNLAPLASGDSFFYQINFDLPLGDDGVTYVVEFDYKINVEGGVAKICEGPAGGYAVLASTDMTIDEDYQHFYGEYTGTLHTGAKVSFELGSVRGETPIDLLINNIVTYEKPGTQELPIIAAGNNQTKVEGAGVWIYLNNTDLGVSGATAAEIVAGLTITADIEATENTPAEQLTQFPQMGVVPSAVEFNDYGAGDTTVRLMINLPAGYPVEWHLKHTIHIAGEINGVEYLSDVVFVSHAYVPAE